MTAGVDLLLSRLHRVKSIGTGQWKASCPLKGHGKGRGDLDPSLSVSDGNGTGIGIYCHVCGKVGDEVLKELGLTWHDILPQEDRERGPRIVATYDYRDENGTLLYQVVRFDPKDFRQRRPDPDKPGEWIWKLGNTRRVLFRHPETIAAVKAGRRVY